MASNLYPLVYKPGIKRDGTLFQSDYCTDGQWVRFQRGNIRKMGGMSGITNDTNGNLITNPQSVALVPFSNDQNIFDVYVAGTNNAGNAFIDIYATTVRFDSVIRQRIGARFNTAGLNAVWQYEYVVQGNVQYIVYMLSPSLLNINDASACEIQYANILNLGPMTFARLATAPSISGLSGLLFASNYLFVYGSNGLVQWSKPNNPLDFGNGATRQISIASDKVIHARSIRGGLNSPAILFWTLSSVVRCINTSTTGDTLTFAIDPLDKSSSILSSRCVVEWNGDFYWPGTDRFFKYTGVVRELENTLNLNYFFNNLDMNYRQQVFGVKNIRYGEIWWFYPEILGTPGRPNVPVGQNTRALIYNVRENSWYDTAISRNCGVHYDAGGFMATYGKPLTNVLGTRNYLFRHEYETYGQFPPVRYAIYERYVDPTGFATLTHIPSTFTTPTFSWANFNPVKQLTGINRWMYLITIEPDFTLMPTLAQGGTDMTVVINTRQYAQDFPLSSPPFAIPVPLITGQDPLLGKVDTAWQGRYLTLTFATTENFEMGQTMLQIGMGDGQ
jgi:hypothetical protein